MSAGNADWIPASAGMTGSKDANNKTNLMKIIFFGTSSVALPILNKLNVAHEVLAVVTSPDAPVGRKQILTPSPVAEFAEKLSIKTFKPEKVKGNEEILKELQNLSADIFIVVSYGKILPKEILELPPLKTLNVHFSLLPKYRGAAPIQAAIKNGDEVSGTTIFILDELLDHGPIIAQKEIAIGKDDTTPVLMEKMAEMSSELLLATLPKYQKGEITPKEQDHEKATKAPMINKTDGLLDFTSTAKICYNIYRSLQPWPGVYTYFQGKILKIIECRRLVPSPSEGRVRERLQTGMVLPGGVIACGENTYLELLQVQLEGGKVLNIKDFINGHKDFIGTII